MHIGRSDLERRLGLARRRIRFDARHVRVHEPRAWTSRLGSDLLFLRSLTQAYHFRPWKDVVFASAARYGAVKPLGGQVLVSVIALLCRRMHERSEAFLKTVSAGSTSSGPIGGPGPAHANQECASRSTGGSAESCSSTWATCFRRLPTFACEDLVGSTGVRPALGDAVCAVQDRLRQDDLEPASHRLGAIRRSASGRRSNRTPNAQLPTSNVPDLTRRLRSASPAELGRELGR